MVQPRSPMSQGNSWTEPVNMSYGGQSGPEIWTWAVSVWGSDNTQNLNAGQEQL